ncbi:hypothetical protein KAU15_03310 [candidate division WOR-3 bacterium]|nr:hypothetical protein [candidate division WOR-3 bacterium]
MKKFPFLEIGIIIALAGLLYILIYPGYIENIKRNNMYHVISNVHACRAAYEKVATLDNIGLLPKEQDPKIIQYINEFDILNPFTKCPYNENDIQFYELWNPLEIADDMLSGKHGAQRGEPGTFAIGIFQPDRSTYTELMEKEDLTKNEKKALKKLNMDVTKYTIIGFDYDSMPIIMEDKTSKKIEVYFIKGFNTSID